VSGRKRQPPEKDVILPLLARLARKWLQIGTDMLLIIAPATSFLEMSTLMTLNDLEPPKLGVLVNFSQFQTATHISRVNHAKMAGDRPKQPAYKIFSI